MDNIFGDYKKIESALVESDIEKEYKKLEERLTLKQRDSSLEILAHLGAINIARKIDSALEIPRVKEMALEFKEIQKDVSYNRFVDSENKQRRFRDYYYDFFDRFKPKFYPPTEHNAAIYFSNKLSMKYETAKDGIKFMQEQCLLEHSLIYYEHKEDDSVYVSLTSFPIDYINVVYENEDTQRFFEFTKDNLLEILIKEGKNE